jgi:serine/threonine-protein kinase
MGGNSGKIGPATDIYSLGVVFYELLSGELPFEGTGSMASIIGQVLTQEPKDLISLRPKLDSQLAAICLKAMAKQIEDRYASMAELADALTQYLKKSQQATVLGIDAHAETKTDLQAVPSAENFLLADLAEVLPPLSQNMATSGTVLRVPSKQRPWLLPTAIGLAVLILACLVWALARDNSQPVPSDHGAPATTTSGDSTPMPKTPAIPVQANPAPPVASQRDNSETRENDALGSSASETIPEKENVESSNASSISAGLLTTKSSAETSAPSNQQSTDLLPSKAPSSSFPESPPRPQSDQVEAPPLPPHPDGKRGPRLGPPPRPGGPLLPRGILIDDFFRDHDKNQDQKLAPDELPAEIRDHLFRADANRDGFLVKKEIREAQPGPGKRRNDKQPR